MSKPQKIKRYRLSVSRFFPSTHPRKGQPTYFVEKIQFALPSVEHIDLRGKDSVFISVDLWKKLHTIRGNYDLWSMRMENVQAGRAVIELFYWEGKPYNSKQVVFAVLDKDLGCGIQKLNFVCHKSVGVDIPIVELVKGMIKTEELAVNDGLSLEDFKAWFKGYDLSDPMAIIQFTKFRY